MTNKNYISGRRWEYKVKDQWEKDGYVVIRASGSHGDFDLVAFNPHLVDMPYFIQCKRTRSESEGMRLLKEWREHPPFPPGRVGFKQVLEVVVHRKWHERVIL